MQLMHILMLIITTGLKENRRISTFRKGCIHVRKKREKKDVCEETSEIYDYTFVITQDQLLHTLRPTGRFFPHSTSRVSLLIVRSFSIMQWIN